MLKVFSSILGVICFGTVSLQADGFASMYDSGAKKTEDKQDKKVAKAGDKQPTTIDSITMNMDMKSNLSIFIGNVVVDTPSMHITCERMEMYFEETVVNGKKKKQVREIHCFKNRLGDLDANDPTDRRVVIIKKPQGDEKTKDDTGEDQRQRSFSGKAVYNVKTGKIVLTDDPILIKGYNEIHGTKITIWRDSDIMDVVDGHINFIEGDEDTGL